MSATNRQKKLLSFFGVEFSPDLTTGAAGWEIGAIMEDSSNRDKWRRYLYLTNDFDADSPVPVSFDPDALVTVEIPEDWNPLSEHQKWNDEIVNQEMPDGSPFDIPAPIIQFSGHSFMFTGKFSFGDRKACQTAVTELGGLASSLKSVSQELNYLIIGSEGSKAWKRGSYGNKIEAAIISRRQHGSPAIISEMDWANQMKKG